MLKGLFLYIVGAIIFGAFIDGYYGIYRTNRIQTSVYYITVCWIIIPWYVLININNYRKGLKRLWIKNY